MVVEIFKSDRKVQPWYVRIRARNGEILATSEGYYSKWNAKRAAKKMFPNLEIVYVVE